ncbi:membrane-bound transcription factor site 2 protease [Medicago truncatula]|uniref:Endopeptidase S2P n=1 Tax=Medicago truncatula TaxID=3880 RepID=A0A072TTS3_MEDTR|nr:membrane-bound transcription factor site 2 protease [Medicago truncatula]
MESSEGIQIEYIAIFIAVLFPGALVAFNDDLLQASEHLTALRIYSAGIWHNAVCCAACGLTLFLLPLLLFPFYSSGHGPMVMDVPSTSPLYGYLAPGDVILSVDNVRIRNAQEWLKLNTLTYGIQLKNVNISQHTGDLAALNNGKGYCVPSLVMEASKITGLLENQLVCSSELNAFVKISCSGNITLDDGQSETDLSNGRRNMYCLNAKDVVKLDKCGDGWGLAKSNGSSCTCSLDEFCLAPVQEPGMVWVEITYSRPQECLREENSFPVSTTSSLKERNCGATFIFVGDVISMAHSIHLTSYQPRWGPKIVAYFPNFLERFLIWTFHISLALALLNGLPVYFLDGESILDATLSHYTSLSPRKRNKVLRLCLLCGLLVSIIGLFRLLL